MRAALDSGDYHYFIRLDIKSYYRAIAHYQLIQDVKHAFSDNKVLTMLTRVIDNAIETPRGYQHDGCGIALRGPLSQLFSALYLKPLDDAISAMDVIYLRYQDDILVLCKTPRQLKRCQQKIKRILDKRHLTLRDPLKFYDHNHTPLPNTSGFIRYAHQSTMCCPSPSGRGTICCGFVSVANKRRHIGERGKGCSSNFRGFVSI